MDKRIELYIIATQNVADMIKSSLQNEPNAKINGICLYGNSFDNLKNGKTSVAIFEYEPNQLLSANKYIKQLKEEEIPFISIVKDVKHGFMLLNEGAADMILLNMDLTKDKEQQKMWIFSLLAKSRTVLVNMGTPARSLKQVSATALKSNKLIAIGSSTGGTEAVLQILRQMPPNAPPILIVQHMPPVFTRLYAERIHKECKISAWEAQDGDILRPGLALIAPGDKHMTLHRNGGEFYVKCFFGEKRNGHCPSVDVFFESIASIAAKETIGVILTGMGKDGAQGLLYMHQNGSFTIGQDEKSCVVYGMPREAYEIGGVDVQEDISQIASVILAHI